MRSLPDQIVLVGLPGSGKSTVGPILAQRLGWQFVDFDAVIEAEAGVPVRDIFAQRGEQEFRRREAELTARLVSRPNLVLAPGGGWILRNELASALLIWLMVSPQEASMRLCEYADMRPLLAGNTLERLRQLLQERAPYYRRAQLQVDTNGLTADAVADAIVVALERYGNEEK